MASDSIRYRLQGARPKLSLVAPLSSYIAWAYVFVNVLLGLGMIFLYNTTVAPIAVASILNYPQWGMLFLVASIVGAYALIKNNWKLVRNIQLYGIALKSFWAVALIVRCFAYPQTILITAVWIFLAYVQIGLYIHFIPPLSGGKNGS